MASEDIVTSLTDSHASLHTDSATNETNPTTLLDIQKFTDCMSQAVVHLEKREKLDPHRHPQIDSLLYVYVYILFSLSPSLKIDIFYIKFKFVQLYLPSAEGLPIGLSLSSVGLCGKHFISLGLFV